MRTRTIAALLFVSLLGASPAGAMTYHDNTVKMPLSASGYTNVTATYVINSFSITSGQDPNKNIYVGLSRTYTGNNGSMTYRIGRKGSSTVASWWKSRIEPRQNTFNDDPGELNFAFLGTLTITLKGGVLGDNQDTYTLNNIALAQGSAGTSNNWWFGGQNCTYTSEHTVKCTGTSTAGWNVNFYFHRGGLGSPVDEVKLNKIEYTAYTLYPLQSRYVGESVRCVWQPTTICPPFVTYYNSTQTATLKLTVRNNLLYNSQGNLFDTSGADPSHVGPAAIFVMDQNSGIYASNQNKVYMFHHSTILAGTSVASAGELIAKQGVLQTMTNCSGHYRPPNAAYNQLLEALHRQGYTRTFTFTPCTPAVLEEFEAAHRKE